MKHANVKTTAGASVGPAGRAGRAADRLRLAATAILLLLACSRMLLTESLSPPWTDFGGVAKAETGDHQDEPIQWGGPTAASSMGIAAWIILAAVLWAGAQAIQPRPVVGRWALVLIALLALAAAISLALASNQAAARNNAAQFLSYLASFWLLLQLLWTKAARQAALVMVLAAGVIFAGYTIYQNYVENPDFVGHKWPLMRAEVFARQGWAGDEPMARLYEERVRSAEAKGFAVNANMAAALLLVVVSASAGWAVQKLSGPRAPLRRVFAGLAGVLAGVALFALLLTRSRGGMIAGVLALLAFAVLGLARRWAAAHWRPLAIGAASLVLVAVVAVTTWSARMTQPGPDSVWYRQNAATSMLFRWQYWVGAARVWRSHPLGVGGGNFRDAYVAEKLPAALEDVDNPHNFALAALVEYGPLGAMALVGLLAWILLTLSRPFSRDPKGSALVVPETNQDEVAAGPSARSLLLLAVGFGVGLAVVRAVLQWPNYGDAVTNFMIVLVGPALVLMLLLTRDRVQWPGDLGEAWVRLAIGCGLAGFLVASAIDFGLTSATSATAFWTLAAIGLAGKLADRGAADGKRAAGGRPGGKAASSSYTWMLAAGGLAVVLIGQLVTVYLPTKAAEAAMWELAKGEEPVMTAGSGSAGQAAQVAAPDYSPEFYRQALAADAWEPEIPAFMASQLAARLSVGAKSPGTRAAMEQVRSLYAEAARRDPGDPHFKLLVGRITLAWKLAESEQDRDEAIQLIKEAASQSPQSAVVWQQLGQALLDAGRDSAAAEAFARAMAIDDTVRMYDVKGLFRFSDRGRAELRKLFEQAQGLGRPATRPAH